MYIWWIGKVLYGHEKDQSTKNIVDWPVRLQSILELQKNSDKIDYPRSDWLS